MRRNFGWRGITGLSIVAIGAALLAIQLGAIGGADAARPRAVQQMPPWLLNELHANGFNNVQYVVVVEPGDRFTAFVPDPLKGVEYNVGLNEKAKIPREGSMQEKDFNEMVVISKNSPAWVVVCEKMGGQKVCWEEQR